MPAQTPEVEGVYLIPQTLTVRELQGRRRIERDSQGRPYRADTRKITPANTLVQFTEEGHDLYGFQSGTFQLASAVLDIAQFRELTRQHIRIERARMRASVHHSDGHDDFARREAYLLSLTEQEEQLEAFLATLAHGAVNLVIEESLPVKVFLQEEQAATLVRLPDTPHVARLNLETR